MDAKGTDITGAKQEPIEQVALASTNRASTDEGNRP
jgi:hypothetical protein